MVQKILAKFEPNRDNLIAILHEIQCENEYRDLKKDDLIAVAKYLDLPESEVYGVASFYSMYSITPAAKNIIRLCGSTTCHLMGSQSIYDCLKNELKVDKDGISSDKLFKIERVECLGLCDHAPAMSICNKNYVNLNEDKVKSIIEEIRKTNKVEGEKVRDKILNKDTEYLRLLRNVNDTHKEKPFIGYEALKDTLKNHSPQEVLDIIKDSGLRGRGGAGFPTGLKWSFTAPLKGEKYIICNADEGEPGTFKDRVIMENDPHLVIEGIILAGYAIGAKKGYIYIRGEYEDSINSIKKAIAESRSVNLLGENILGTSFTFDIEIKFGAGAYVVGEETALIESLEGYRGNPRIKPPFPAIKGLWQKPSVVNNVETLANVPLIIKNGSNWFKKLGTERSPGTKLVMLIGKVKKTGIAEVPLGMTLREIIDNYGGGILSDKKFKAALVGGAAGGFLGGKYLDTPLDYDTMAKNGFMLGSGSVLVLDEDTDILDLLINIMEFFKHESCGQCAPCRIGNPTILKLLKLIKNKTYIKGNEWELIMKTAKTMKKTSLCPLGQSPILPLKTAYEQFKDELVRR